MIQELKTISYHKLYDILKQHQNEVNELRAERIAHTANHSQHHPTYYTQNSSTRSQQAATRNRGKAIVNSPLPIYDQEPSMVAEDDEMSKDKKIDKLMALISLSFNKIYKPTNNSLRTSSNTSRANKDNSPRINRGTGYDNQRLRNVVGARETVDSTVVQKSRIQCYNCKEFGHVARECQKPKRAKDATDHKEKMLLYQELEAHYMYMAQIHEVSPDAADSGPLFDSEPVKNLIEIVLFIVNSGCSKHMTGNLKLLINFVEKFLGTVKFGNDQIAPILGYGDLVQGAVTIKRVYYVKGLNHNLFFVS
nr:integrase, catalytic region, zinc finger, CCHC-type, peptidase aspartic, catalytic [Tanacetum cinerariifolium]